VIARSRRLPYGDRLNDVVVASGGIPAVRPVASDRTDDQILITGVRRPQAPRIPGLDDAGADRALVERKARSHDGHRGRPPRRPAPGATPWLPRTASEVAFHGEYREIVPNERIVSTEVYEGVPQGDGPEQGTLNTATFTEEDGRTTLTILVQCPSKAVRDAIIESGMEAGMQDAMDLLEGVAISLR
jgi:hypothetical protein